MPDKLILRDWHAIREYLEPRLTDIQLVSLDIFDTILYRCVGDPAEVQQAVCRIVGERIQLPQEAVWHARQLAEQELRAAAQEQGLDHECSFSALVPRWIKRLPHFTVDSSAEFDLEQFIIDTELDLEASVLHTKPDAQVFMDWVREQDIALIAISDMYLDGKFLSELLRRCGILDYFAFVYVSADFQLGKYTGRLFEKMLQMQKLSPQQVVHIGDNPISDRRMACRMGIQGVWLFEKPDIQRREQQVLSSQMAQRGGIWKGRSFFEMVAQRSEQQQRLQPQNFHFRYGHEVLGPAFSAFMLGLQERLAQQAKQGRAIEKLLFVARDGFLFHKMYQAVGGEIPAEYVYLSRKVITAASVADGLAIEDVVVAFYNPKQRGLESVCKVYALPEDELRPLAAEHGFSDFAEPIHDWADSRLQNFLKDPVVQEIVQQAGRKNRDLLQRYLEQVGLFAHQRVALIDIGWNGTVQKFLKQAFGGREDFPAINGYYFAFVPKMYTDFGDNNVAEGIVHDMRRGNPCERIPAEFEEVFEQGARSQEATTIAYREHQGTVLPVLKPDSAPDRQAELQCNVTVGWMQDGVLHHWEHFRAIQKITGYSSEDLLPYVYGLLERAVVYPTREETQALTQLAHTEDFGHDHVLDLGSQPVRWRDLLRPKRLLQRLEVSAWRYALFSGMPTGFANFAFRVAYLHMVKK